jgi:hypothetical protein
MAVYDGEPDVLRRLLGLTLAGASGPEMLSEPAIAAYLLLDVEKRSAIEPFLTRSLGRLLRNLDHDTQQKPVACRGRLRGRVSWPATYQARYGQDFDPGRYVCREIRRQYDTPENQLVKLLVERLAVLLKAFPDALRGGAGYLPDSAGVPSDVLANAPRLARMEASVQLFRRSVYFREVSEPREITRLHLARAEASRLAEYVEAARVYRRYRAVLAAPPREVVAGIGRRVLLLPGSADAEGEPWLRLASALILRQDTAG